MVTLRVERWPRGTQEETAGRLERPAGTLYSEWQSWSSLGVLQPAASEPGPLLRDAPRLGVARPRGAPLWMQPFSGLPSWYPPSSNELPGGWAGSLGDESLPCWPRPTSPETGSSLLCWTADERPGREATRWSGDSLDSSVGEAKHCLRAGRDGLEGSGVPRARS